MWAPLSPSALICQSLNDIFAPFAVSVGLASEAAESAQFATIAESAESVKVPLSVRTRTRTGFTPCRNTVILAAPVLTHTSRTGAIVSAAAESTTGVCARSVSGPVTLASTPHTTRAMR